MPPNISHWGILRFDAGMMLLFYAPQVFRQRLYLGTGYKLQGEKNKGLGNWARASIPKDRRPGPVWMLPIDV